MKGLIVFILTFGRIFFIDPNPLASLWILYHTTNKQTTTWRPKILKKKINFPLIMTKYWLNFRKCKQLPTTADRPNERKLSHKEKIVTITRYSSHLSPRICMHWWVTVLTLIDFTLSNAGRFYLTMGNPLGWKGLMIATTLIYVLSLFWCVLVQCWK